jgi:diacylglycerol O-acyltransferase / wax synthase
LTASIPVSVRTEEEAGEPGNRLAGLMVSLATDVTDPVERLHAIVEATAQAKEIQGAVGARLMTDWMEFATPVVAGRAFRFISRSSLLDRLPPLFNVSISNIPGPQFPLYFAGAQVLSMYPMGPVMNGSALNITVVSYDGTMLVGLIADRDLVPDLDDFADALPAAVADLLKVAVT